MEQNENMSSWVNILENQVPRKSSVLLEGRYDFISLKRSVIRILTDSLIRSVFPTLEGDVYDLGGAPKTAENYRKLVRGRYIVTNIKPPYDQFADMLNLPFLNDSVDNLISLYSLEHVPDPYRACQEMYRVLRVGGRLVLIAPFLLRHHARPDYYRFSPEGLNLLFDCFKEKQMYYVGGILDNMAHSFWPYRGISNRLISNIFYHYELGISLWNKQPCTIRWDALKTQNRDEVNACSILILAEKTVNS